MWVSREYLRLRVRRFWCCCRSCKYLLSLLLHFCRRNSRLRPEYLSFFPPLLWCTNRFVRFSPKLPLYIRFPFPTVLPRKIPPHWCRNSRGLYCVRRWLYSIWFGRGWSILNRLVSWIWNTKVSKEISRWCYNFWTCFYISYRETYMYFCWRFPWFCPFFEIWYMVIAVFIAAWILLWIVCKYITYRPKG